MSDSFIGTRAGGGERPSEPPQLTIEALQARLEEAEAKNAVGAIDAPPVHYAGDGIDVFAIIDAFHLDFYEGNCIKYILRHKKKHGMNDLLKARHYLDEVIARAGEHGA